MYIRKKLKCKFLLIAITIMLIISGCGLFKNGGTSETPPTGENPPKQQIDLIKQQVDRMTLDEKIGQMVLVGIEGYQLNENTKSLIQKHRVGGVILYKQNIKNAEQLLSLINSLKQTNEQYIPLFISVDEEGGRVSRMPEEIKKLPAARAIGDKNDIQLAYDMGATVAELIKAFGFNMNFAPVLDINSNPKNPVIGDRAFATEPEKVSRIGIAVMKGIQSGNVIPVVKHFPGHGDTSVDSHIGLPVVQNDIERLKNFELIPFKEAIENDAEVVMIAHILLPEIDEESPATLSKKLITDILKNELGFKGLVITDDMTMGAILENYEIGEAAIKSLAAGADIILVAHEYEKQIQVLEAMKKAVEDNIIPESRIDESVYRIIKLKEKYNLKNQPIDNVKVEIINKKTEEVLINHGLL